MAAIADYIQALSIGTDAFGEDAWIAYARVGLYGFLAFKTFNGTRPISYGLMTAAGISIATSLTAGAWGRK